MSVFIEIQDFSRGSVVKNPPAKAGDTRDSGSFPRSGRSLEEEMAAHPSILVWEIPQTEEAKSQTRLKCLNAHSCIVHMYIHVTLSKYIIQLCSSHH